MITFSNEEGRTSLNLKPKTTTTEGRSASLGFESCSNPDPKSEIDFVGIGTSNHGRGLSDRVARKGFVEGKIVTNSQTRSAVSLAEKISDAKYATTREFDRTYKEYGVDLVPEGEGRSLLDIGCGTGLNSERLSSKGYEITGVDISAVAIEQYRSRGFRGHVEDVTRGMSFQSASFDVVFAADVIEHLVDIELFGKEVFRVLKPGGILVLSTPNSAFWVYRILGVLGRTVSELQHPGHLQFFSKRFLRSLLNECGFGRAEFCARHIFLLAPDPKSGFLRSLIERIGFRREYRFATGNYFYHLSCFGKRCNPFWADMLLVRARKN